MPSPICEALERRRLLSAAITPPDFVVDPNTVWPAEHEFEPEIFSSNLPIHYSLLNAPKGMRVVNIPQSYVSLITWTPTESQVGTYKVTVVGTNSAGTLKVPFSIKVTPDVPELYDYFGTNVADQGVPYGMVGVPTAIQVGDSSAQKSTFSIISSPAGVSINPSTGLIKWTPIATEAGNTKIVVRGKNIFGTSDLTIAFPTYTAPAVTDIVVKTNGLNPPTMSWTQPTNSLEKIAGYNIVLQAFGPNGGTTFDFNRESPATSFKLQGLPRGDYEFIPTVTPIDAAGHMGLSTTGAAFEYGTGVPVLSTSPSPLVTAAGGRLEFNLNDSDTVSPVTFAIVSAPAGLSFEYQWSNSILSWIPTDAQVGEHTIVFSATDSLGTHTQSVQILVQPPVPYYMTDLWVSDVTPTGFTLNWAKPADAKFIAGYTVDVSYGPSGSLSASANVSSGATSFHFSNPNLGLFAARVSAFNSLLQEGELSQWASLGNSIYNPTN
jgi:hypothetical protein